LKLDSGPEFKLWPPGNKSEFLWEIKERYDGRTDICQWTVEAETTEKLAEAKTLIRRVLQWAICAAYIGLLTFPDKSRFAQIVGQGGENLVNLERETETVVQVPPKHHEDNKTIVIIGAK
jgi:hypothetical protein